MMTQAQFMRKFNEDTREQFNPIFFKRNNQDIMDCMKLVIMSCERDKYFTLKVMGMREIYNYEEIITILHDWEAKNKPKNSSAENPYDFINIKDSDIMLLEVQYLIRHNGTEIVDSNNGGPTEVVRDPWEILTVYIALPRFSEKYYLRLSGNYYSDIFQIVDGSTYNNAALGNNKKSKKAACNSFKTIFTPVRVFRMYRELKDFYSNEPVKFVLYTSIIPLVYNTHHNCMYFMLANFGLYATMVFLDIDCVQIDNKPIDDERFYNFEKNGIYISCPKECAKDSMVQSFVATLYDGIKNDTTLEDMFDTRHWLKVLGKCYRNESVDKGLFILDSLDGIYDIVTKQELHLPDDYKQDIYQILRWIMREFKYLRDKENVDVTIKRYRLAEPIAAIYGSKLITGILRISDMGRKVTLKSVKRAVKIHPMYIINRIINKNNLIAYRDMVNDNDATTALKWTFKGVSGLGENGTSIQQIYRFVDPSHAGILDLDSSTTSDPGMTGMLCPMAKVYPGNSFSEYEEPNNWESEMKPLQDQFRSEYYKDGIDVLQFGNKDHPYVEDLQELRKKIIEETNKIDIPECPVTNIKGEDMTIFAEKLKEEQNEIASLQSLFTIIPDEEDDDYYEEDMT